MLSVAASAPLAVAAADGGRLEARTAMAAAAAAVLGFGLAAVGGVGLVLILALPVLVAAVVRPAFGAYLFLFANPLIVGIARGEPIPLLRPNEALLLLLVLAAVVRLAARVLSGGQLRPKVDGIDLAMLLLVVTGSLLPLAWRELRGLPITIDDVLYAFVLWKYLALYWLFRQSITTGSQVLACVVVSMASGLGVAIVAMLQVTGQFGVADFLFQYYDAPFTGYRGPITTRGTSTIASSFGTADVMIMNLLLALALLRIARWRSWALAVLALAFFAGCLAAGSFSGVIGLGFALLVFGVAARQTGRIVLAGVPATILAAVAFWPVIAERLEGFERQSGMPQSWEGRWANLRDFFLPEILSGMNWLTGVRPAARVPAPEPWRDWVYIESGYVWLVWIGGLPFLLAFLAFVVVGASRLWPMAVGRADAVGAAALAAFAYLLVIALLMLLDPHLTIRGSADLFFPLLALALVRPPGRSPSGLPASPSLSRIGLPELSRPTSPRPPEVPGGVAPETPWSRA